MGHRSGLVVAEVRRLTSEVIGGGGGSRTRVRKCYWSRDYMLIHVHAPGITLGRSRPLLRTDKKRSAASLKILASLPRRSREEQPSV